MIKTKNKIVAIGTTPDHNHNHNNTSKTILTNEQLVRKRKNDFTMHPI